MLIELDGDQYEMILKAKEHPYSIDVNDQFFKPLIEGRFLVTSNKTERNKLLLSSLARRFNPNNLSLTIAPTQACNFGCPYCYETNRKGRTMEAKVQDGIIDFVSKNEMVKNLSVVWYGGEPTLAIEAIERLSLEFQNRVKSYSAFMVTNGFYLDRIVDNLNALKIKGLQITLDGTKETHDKTRCLSNGGGTFDQILSNIDKVVNKGGVAVSIRMNVSNENSGEYTKLHSLLAERYKQKVSLYPAFVHDYNKTCQAGYCLDDNVQKARFLKKIFEENDIYTKDLYPSRKNLGCMTQMLNSFVIGTKGELYKCWHHLGVENKVVGNILSEKVVSNYSLFSDMMLDNDAIFDNNCKSCVLFPSCDGGCADIKRSGDDYCIPAKAMLEEFLDIRHFVRTQNWHQE